MTNAREAANYKNAFERYNVIMLTTVGSTLLGLESEGESDIDEMGICLEEPKQLLGFSPFEHYIYRTAEDRTGKVDAKSEVGDIDLTLYGLRKFVRMALSGNPNIISIFYVPAASCKIYTPIAAELQALREHFKSNAVLRAFLNYGKAQMHRLEGSRGGMDVNRQELVDRYGYDVKYAMHANRLLIQGFHFATYGQLDFPLDSDTLNLLRDIRLGAYSFRDMSARLQKNVALLEQVLEHSQFPESPNYDLIEKWLLKTYTQEWYENKTSSQQYRATSNTKRENSGTGPSYGQEIEREIPF